MTHEDDRPLETLKSEQEGRFGLGVEVVRRLIEQQHVVSADNDPCKSELRTFTARESSCFLLDLVCEQEEPQYGAQFAVRESRSLAHMIQDGRRRMDILVFLCVVADRHPISDLDLSEVWCLSTRQDPQERRLSRTVEPHDHQPVTSVDDHINIDEHNVQTVGLGKIGASKGDLA